MKKLLVLPSVVYSLLSIIAICVVFYGKMYHLINTVYIITLLLLFPFVFFTLKTIRNKEYNGNIGGKEALRTGLKFVMIAAVIMVAFQAVFFLLDFKNFKINFIQTSGQETLKNAIQLGKVKAKEADIPKMLNEDIQQLTLFAEITPVFFRYLVYGLFSSFISAVFLKRFR